MEDFARHNDEIWRKCKSPEIEGGKNALYILSFLVFHAMLSGRVLKVFVAYLLLCLSGIIRPIHDPLAPTGKK